ncbi:MAG: hypothetical protein HQL71_14300 [Magnetococcales bacterium]|nr:hypothetical protein [Magnetococcales bacterium]
MSDSSENPKKPDGEKHTNSSFSGSSYFIPFGRHAGPEDGLENDADELIGREGLRSYLVHALLDSSPQGAFLVTGRRGVGKTSFVEYCLREFKENTFKRYMTSNVGRTLTDYLAVVLIAFLMLVTMQLLSEFSGYLLLQDPLPYRILFAIPFIAPIFAFLLYSKNILYKIFTVLNRMVFKHPLTIFEKVVLFSFVAFLPLVILVQLLSNSINLDNFITLLSVQLLCTALIFLSINNLRTHNHSTLLPIVIFTSLTVFVIFSMYLPSTGIESSTANINDENKAITLLSINEIGLFGLTLLTMAVDFLLRSICYSQKARARARDRKVVDKYDIGKTDKKLSISYMLLCITGIIGLLIYIILMPELSGNLELYNIFNYFISIIYNCEINIILILSIFIMMFSGRVVTKRLSDANTHNNTNVLFRMVIILWLKAIFSIIVFAHFFAPVLATFNNNEPFITSYSLNQQLIWTGLIMAITHLFFWMEYEWIQRPILVIQDEHKDSNQKDDNRVERSSFLKHNLIWFRHLESLSLPRFLFQSWLPTIVVNVNLGFDRLDHREVIQGMLSGLQEQYRKLFIAWYSRVAFLRNLMAVAIILLATNLMGKAFFVLPDLNEEKIRKSYEKIMSASVEERYLANSYSAVDQYSAIFDNTKKDEPWSLTVRKLVKEKKYTSSFCRFLLEDKYKSNEQFAENELGPVPRTFCLYSNSEFWLSFFYFPLIPNDIKLEIPTKDGSKNATSPNTNSLVSYLFHNNYPLPVGYNKPEKRIVGDSNVENQQERDGSLKGCDFGDGKAGIGNSGNCKIENTEYVKSLSPRVYHLLLFLFSALTFYSLAQRIPVLPYRRNLNKIDDLLTTLSSRTLEKSSHQIWKPALWLNSLFSGDQKEKEIEISPRDPRSVESAFMEVLNTIQDNRVHFLSEWGIHMTIPSPEITFLFDELDKLTGRVEQDENKPYDYLLEKEVQTSERLRSLAVNRLFSDMKRIISSTNARFIFVGGRLLHDEWLADKTARQPMLTSIFNHHIYIPSLLTDWSPRSRDRFVERMNVPEELVPVELKFSKRIQEYLGRQHRRANQRYQMEYFNRRAFPLMLSVEKGSVPTFPSTSYWIDPFNGERKLKNDLDDHDIKVYIQYPWERLSGFNQKYLFKKQDDEQKDEENEIKQSDEEEAFIRSFIRFLTYRSAGNPKRLKEMLGVFIRQLHSIEDRSDSKILLSNCHDVLYFSDPFIYRVQFVEELYLKLSDAFGSQFIHRDDKAAVSMFYIADFLFKLHWRAFAWSNLERVEEFTHIHRMPDLRELLEKVVYVFSDRYLHKVLNGMYAFRFRSEIALEIKYVSNSSEEEMAAFNFTLDESQSLKALFHNLLKEQENVNLDIVTGLGELYEYDQDFAGARQQYRHAILLVDEEFSRISGCQIKAGGRSNDDLVSSMGAVLLAQEAGIRSINQSLDWGVARLRLMLQHAMTYEQSNNLEQAEVEYRNTCQLARMLIISYGKLLDEQNSKEDTKQQWGLSHKQLLKHVNILYQPFFASAWVAEKNSGGVDTGPGSLEKDLLWLRMQFGMTHKEELIKKSLTPSQVSHSNYLLILAELHHKAGNLLFFKGSQQFDVTELNNRSDFFNCQLNKEYQQTNNSNIASSNALCASSPKVKPKFMGYLPRAYYHYVVSLHEIRRFIIHRHQSSGFKYSLEDSCDPTMHHNNWPHFVNMATANVLGSMADTVFASISLKALKEELEGEQYRDKIIGRISVDDFSSKCSASDKQRKKPTLIDIFDRWLSSGEFPSDKSCASCPPNIRVGEGDSILYRPIDIDTTQDGKNLIMAWLKDWFGEHNSAFKIDFNPVTADEAKQTPKKSSLVVFGDRSFELDRLFVSIGFMQIAAEYMNRGGYPADAGIELLQTCNSITQFIWSLRAYSDEQTPLENSTEPLDRELTVKDKIILLLGIWGLRLLKRADVLFRKGKVRALNTSGDYAGRDIPHKALTQTFSLALALGDRLFLTQPLSFESKLKVDAEFKNSKSRVSNLRAGLIERLGAWIKHEEVNAIFLEGFKKRYPLKKENCKKMQNEMHEYRDKSGSFFKKVIMSKVAEQQEPESQPSLTSNRQSLVFICGLQEGLKLMIRRYRYPMLNRMGMLKLLLDSILIYNPFDWQGEFDKWGQELYQWELLFNAPMHFTSFKSGITYSLCNEVILKESEFLENCINSKCLVCIHSQTNLTLECMSSQLDQLKEDGEVKNADCIKLIKNEIFKINEIIDFTAAKEDIAKGKEHFEKCRKNKKRSATLFYRLAKDKLVKSREMYSLGRAYYENINNLFYLFDDFNDRSIHHNHALQMFAADLVIRRTKKLDDENKDEPKVDD